MSNGGTRSVIHFDADHNIHCIVAGAKDFIMIDQKFKKELKLSKVINELNEVLFNGLTV